MTKLILAVLVAFIMSTTVRADEANSQAIAGEASVSQTKWIDGNWTSVAHYGDPNDAAGLKASQEVAAQQAAYTEAKKAKNTEAMVENALVTSAAAWAIQNRGYRTVQSITEPLSSEDTKTKALSAKADFLKAIDVATNAPATDYKGETNDRKSVIGQSKKNLLYVQRVLGEVAWPKKNKHDGEEAE